MVTVSLYAGLNKDAKFEAKVSQSIYDQHAVDITHGLDTVSLLFSIDQLTEVKDKIEQYLIWHKAIETATAGLSK